MSFPFFSSLPREIQDQIWAFAIPRLPSTAHLIKLKTGRWKAHRNRGSPRTQTTFHRVYNADIPEPPFSVQATRDAIKILYNTCRASRAVAQRISSATEIKTALLRPTLLDPETGDGPSLPPLRVNVVTDLIVLDPSWYHHVPGYLPVALGRARNMALGFLDPGLAGINMRDVFGRLMKMYYDLVVAYVLIEPKDLLIARETSWPDNAEAVATMEAFIAAYDSGGKAPGPWIRGGREYYEIPKEEVRALGGLRWVVGILEAVRLEKLELGKLNYRAVKDRSKYSTRHRLMSWREA